MLTKKLAEVMDSANTRDSVDHAASLKSSWELVIKLPLGRTPNLAHLVAVLAYAGNNGLLTSDQWDQFLGLAQSAFENYRLKIAPDKLGKTLHALASGATEAAF